MKYFLDTNIIMDFFLESRKNFKLLKVLLKEIKKRDEKAVFWIDRDSISTINYLLRKNQIKNEITREVIKSFNIACNTSILREALNVSIEENLDYEDVVKVRTAEELESILFLTEDKKLLKSEVFKITILSVEQMLLKFGFQKNLLGEFTLPEPQIEIERKGLAVILEVRVFQEQFICENVKQYVENLTDAEVSNLFNEKENQKIFAFMENGVSFIAP